MQLWQKQWDAETTDIWSATIFKNLNLNEHEHAEVHDYLYKKGKVNSASCLYQDSNCDNHNTFFGCWRWKSSELII